MAEFKPHAYQRSCIARLLADTHVGLFLDMGLGKTVITLSAIRELIYDQLTVQKCLIIAPKKVAEATWQSEAEKWNHLRGVRFSSILGDAKARRAALARAADVYVINRDNVAWLVDLVGRAWPFDMVVCDESSSFKSASSKRFRALRRVLAKTHRIVLLTGTPAPDGLADLWAQIYLLDRGERLGRTITAYREAYFEFNPYTHAYKPRRGAFDVVMSKIADVCVSMRAKDYLDVPPIVMHDVPVVLDTSALAQYRRLERDMLLGLPDADITAASAVALAGKLLQLCNGAVYDETHEAHELHNCKIEALAELLEGIHGEHALLLYGFRHDVPRIQIVLEKMRLRGRLLETAADVDAWNAGDVDVLIAHPASCAYGLNLQHGGRHVIWFGLPWALELYQQANARLHRQGQALPVIVHRLIARDGMDNAVAEALAGKHRMQDALFDALKARRNNAYLERVI